MASPHLRHQLSLEDIIDFSAKPPLGENERIEARRRFDHVVDHFEGTEKRDGGGTNSRHSSYNRPALVRLTYELSLSEESKDIYLRAFFSSLPLPMTGEEEVDFSDKDLEEKLRSNLLKFADYLLDNFFLPLKASTKKTPQPTPAVHSAIETAQQGGVQPFVGTLERVAALRKTCLIRDRHRCVISRRFDQTEAEKRWDQDGENFKDDDGNSLFAVRRGKLEVAHILPHSLTKMTPDSELSAPKQAALAILNMFDSGVRYLIEGTNIDQPRNAITLTPDLHMAFGNFKLYFTPTEQEQHTYKIESFLPPHLLPDDLLPPEFPGTRTLCLTPTRTIIDPPLPRLLAIHRAVSHILHLSAAGAYIDKILDDVEETTIRADGSTDLGRILSLGLGGWLQATV